MDERADGVAHGGIWCAILTGQPPFVCGGVLKLFARAAPGDFSAAFV